MINNKSIFLLPVIIFLLLFAFGAFWLWGFIMLFTKCEVLYEEGSIIGNMEWDDFTIFALIAMVFLFLWIVAFLISLK